MKQFYSIVIAVVIAMQCAFGQEVIHYENTHPAAAETQLELDVNGMNVLFKPATDNQVHITYKVKFERYINRHKKQFLEKNAVVSTKEGSTITVTAKGKMPFAFLFPFFGSRSNGPTKEAAANDNFDKTPKLHWFAYNSYLAQFYSNEIEDYPKRKKYADAVLEVQLPQNVAIKLKGNSVIAGFTDIQAPISLNIEYGGVLATNLAHKANQLFVKDGFVRIGSLANGSLTLRDVKIAQINQLYNTKLNSSFSDVYLGQLSGHNTIVDFNSKYWCKGLAKDFTALDLEANYAEFHFFDAQLKDLVGKMAKTNVVKEALTINNKAVQLNLQNSLFYYDGKN